MITGMEESSVTIEVFADASFGNVEGRKTQKGFYVGLADGLGNRSPVIWKSKVARRVIGSTLAAEIASVMEAIEWAKYVRYLWEEIVDDSRTCRIMVFTDCNSLGEVLKTVTNTKNRMFRITLAQIKEKQERGPTS